MITTITRFPYYNIMNTSTQVSMLQLRLCAVYSLLLFSVALPMSWNVQLCFLSDSRPPQVFQTAVQGTEVFFRRFWIDFERFSPHLTTKTTEIVCQSLQDALGVLSGWFATISGQIHSRLHATSRRYQICEQLDRTPHRFGIS